MNVREALTKSAERFCGLSDEPPHIYHTFRECPHEYCMEARQALAADQTSLLVERSRVLIKLLEWPHPNPEEVSRARAELEQVVDRMDPSGRRPERLSERVMRLASQDHRYTGERNRSDDRCQSCGREYADMIHDRR